MPAPPLEGGRGPSLPLAASGWALALPSRPDVSLTAAPSSSLITQGLEIKSHHRLIFVNENTRLGWDFYLFC